MKHRCETHPDDVVWISVPLDAETAVRLQALSDECHAAPHSVASSLLRDVLEDDEVHNGDPMRAGDARTLN